ncbi:MAG: dTDP-4-amino-4,6-dideoxy-D-galactose acyltransferase [Gaiellaceae bacterium]|nr:dTDP-4-amino-4,6-dideoxy-D-galactose acyltransferase [Gaiellaceae bacterium]
MSDAPCELLEWDTEFWGVRVARVLGGSMTEESRADLARWCVDNGVSGVYFLAEANDEETKAAAEGGGFFYTDSRVTLRKEVHKPRAVSAIPVRVAEDRDLEALEAIARSSHETTRFYHDPHFPDDRCGELYAQWIRSTYASDDVVLIIEHDGRAVAYVTCGLREGNTGYIGLIAVDASMRERGLGAALAVAAHNWMVEHGVKHAAVVTQERNVAAMHLIQNAGYVVDSTHLWFHKWYDR